MDNIINFFRIQGKDANVKAKNAILSKAIAQATNVEDAIDNLADQVAELGDSPIDQQRITALEAAVDGIKETQREIIYTKDDCTIENSYIYVNGGQGSDSNHNCSDYIPIPCGARMFIQMNYQGADSHALAFYRPRQLDANGDESRDFISKINDTAMDSSGEFVEYTSAIPDDALWLRFNYKKSNANNVFNVKFVYDDLGMIKNDVVKLKVASWNIGGFSHGNSTYTSITQETKEVKKAAFKRLFDEVNADILFLSEYEYDGKFAQGDTTTAREEIFSNYPYCRIGSGSRVSMSYNALFSKIRLAEARKEIKFYRPTGNEGYRYWVESTIIIKGKVVKIAATHFDSFNTDYPNVAPFYLNQFQQILDYYENDPYVIIGADFNVHSYDQHGYAGTSGTEGAKNYAYWTERGYTLFNHDYRVLTNPRSTQSDADNIAVKGFAMGKREYLACNDNEWDDLSDHSMVACELVML